MKRFETVDTKMNFIHNFHPIFWFCSSSGLKKIPTFCSVLCSGPTIIFVFCVLQNRTEQYCSRTCVLCSLILGPDSVRISEKSCPLSICPYLPTSALDQINLLLISTTYQVLLIKQTKFRGANFFPMEIFGARTNDNYSYQQSIGLIKK